MTSPSSSINIASNSSFLILPFFNFFAILSSFANSSQSSSSSSSSLTAAIFFRSRSSCSSLLRLWRYSLFRSFFSLLSSRRALASRLADHASFDALQQQKQVSYEMDTCHSIKTITFSSCVGLGVSALQSWLLPVSVIVSLPRPCSNMPNYPTILSAISNEPFLSNVSYWKPTSMGSSSNVLVSFLSFNSGMDGS